MSKTEGEAMFRFRHGDEVKDKITGLKGIVVARTDWFNKCVRYVIQPVRLKDDGTPHDVFTFDDEQLDLVRAGRIAAPVKVPTGGPQNDRAAQRRN